MKVKFISMIAIVATLMSACCNKPKTYNSVDEYPEYKGNTHDPPLLKCYGFRRACHKRESG